MNIPAHPAACIFPMIEGAEFEAFTADIKENGLLEKIITLDGQILDGRNRFRACVAAEHFTAEVSLNTGMWFVEFNEHNFGADAIEAGPVAFVLSKNLTRRHLDVHQRAMVAARLATMRQGERTDVEEPSANLRKVSQDDAAAALHVSTRSLQSARSIQEKGTPELIHAVEQGKLAVSLGAAAAKLDPEKQRKIAEMAEAGQANPVRTVIKQGARDARETALGAKILALPDKRYGVILADPEWEFVVWSNITGLDRSAINHYEVSPWEKISARDIQKIAAKDCLLCLWVTDLERGLRVMRSWGFEYKSYFVWEKDIVPVEVNAGLINSEAEIDRLCKLFNLSRDELRGGNLKLYREVGPAGTGYWNRDRDEIMLVGTRGKVVCPAMGTQGESVWHAARPKLAGTQRGRHSAKPENAHLWVEQHYPGTPKIELNARAARPGWDVWGYEAPEDDKNSGIPAGSPASDLGQPEMPGATASGSEPDRDGAGPRVEDETTSAKPTAVASVVDLDEDTLYGRAVALVTGERVGSTSYVQRKLEIGYNSAVILMDRMERAGIVSAPDHRGAREVLAPALGPQLSKADIKAVAASDGPRWREGIVEPLDAFDAERDLPPFLRKTGERAAE